MKIGRIVVSVDQVERTCFSRIFPKNWWPLETSVSLYRIVFFCQKKKKKIPGHFCTWRIYWSWSFRGAFNGQKRAPFCFHWCAVEEFYGIFLRLLCVRRAQWKWSAAIDCQRPFWTKNYWLRGGGGGWPFIRMKSTWITSILSFLGKEIGENQVEAVYWIKFYLNLIFEFFQNLFRNFCRFI